MDLAAPDGQEPECKSSEAPSCRVCTKYKPPAWSHAAVTWLLKYPSQHIQAQDLIFVSLFLTALTGIVHGSLQGVRVDNVTHDARFDGLGK